MAGFCVPTASLLGSQQGAGTALTNSTTATALNTAAGAAQLSKTWWGSWNSQPATMRICANGVVSTAASSQGTLTLGIYPDTTQGTLASTALAATSAFTPGASLSGAFWSLVIDVVPDATTTVLAQGFLTIQAASAGITLYQVGSATHVTLSQTSDYLLEVGATWGTASSSNSITLQQFYVVSYNG